MNFSSWRNGMQSTIDPDVVERLRDKITEELVAMMGFSRTGTMRKIIAPVFRPMAVRFAGIVARFDDATMRGGLSAGAACMLSQFDIHVHVSGAERIPSSGPLLVVSNHPGAYDSVVLGSSIVRRDLAVVVSDVPFLRSLPTAGQYLIPVSMDPLERMGSLRTCIRHLQSGGALLIFAHGDVEPDPAFMPGASAELANWSRSVEIMLRKVPQTRLQIAIASGVLFPKFVYNPLTRLRKEPEARQKLGEFLQISQQMIFPHSTRAHVNVSFDLPVSVDALAAEARRIEPGSDDWMLAVVERARQHLDWHMQSIPEQVASEAVKPAAS